MQRYAKVLNIEDTVTDITFNRRNESPCLGPTSSIVFIKI